MFDSLTEKLNTVFRVLKGQGKLTEKNIKTALREARLALLEADVHYKTARTQTELAKSRNLDSKSDQQDLDFLEKESGRDQAKVMQTKQAEHEMKVEQEAAKSLFGQPRP